MGVIDFNHWLGSQIGYQIMDNAENEARLQIISHLKPRFGKDGNQFFYIIGELPEPDCIVGFGESPYEAMVDFCKAFYNKK